MIVSLSMGHSHTIARTNVAKNGNVFHFENVTNKEEKWVGNMAISSRFILNHIWLTHASSGRFCDRFPNLIKTKGFCAHKPQMRADRIIISWKKENQQQECANQPYKTDYSLEMIRYRCIYIKSCVRARAHHNCSMNLFSWILYAILYTKTERKRPSEKKNTQQQHAH